MLRQNRHFLNGFGIARDIKTERKLLACKLGNESNIMISGPRGCFDMLGSTSTNTQKNISIQWTSSCIDNHQAQERGAYFRPNSSV